MRTYPHGGRKRGPVLVILYLRLSDSRKEGGTFVDRERDLRGLADRRGWVVLRTVIENDVMGEGVSRKSASAFKRRKLTLPDGRVEWRVYRPGFRSILDDLAEGRAHALLAEDLDRVTRDPRDLEDLIDVCERTGASADSMSGSIRFTDGGTDAEITTARIHVTMANKSSRDTARRVAAGRERKAKQGEFGGGQRPFGFLADGETIDPAEAAEIVKAGEGVLADISLRDLAYDLRKRGVPTSRGTRWTAGQLKDILLRPRNAGIMVHRPEGEARGRYTIEDEIGPASWPPILPEDQWRAIVAKLTDPNRSTTPGPAHKWLGSGIYHCVCGEYMGVFGQERPTYRCRALGSRDGRRHVVRNLAAVDGLVIEAVVQTMTRLGTAALVPPTASADDPVELRGKLVALRTRKKAFAADHGAGHIDREDMLAGIAALRPQIADHEQRLAALTARSPLAPLVEAENVGEAWQALSLGAQREIVRTLFTVTILPTTARGRASFEFDSVRIERARPNSRIPRNPNVSPL